MLGEVLTNMAAKEPSEEEGDSKAEVFFKAPALRRRNGVQHQAVIPVSRLCIV